MVSLGEEEKQYLQVTRTFYQEAFDLAKGKIASHMVIQGFQWTSHGTWDLFSPFFVWVRVWDFYFYFLCVCFYNSIWMECLREYNVEAMGLKDFNDVEFLTITKALGVVSQVRFILS